MWFRFIIQGKGNRIDADQDDLIPANGDSNEFMFEKAIMENMA